jgi:hypothetical protein
MYVCFGRQLTELDEIRRLRFHAAQIFGLDLVLVCCRLPPCACFLPRCSCACCRARAVYDCVVMWCVCVVEEGVFVWLLEPSQRHLYIYVRLSSPPI